MKIATSLWFKNLRANKPSAPSTRHRLDEMYEETVKIAYDYMADHGQRIQSEFDDLFDGNLRVAIPLVEGDWKGRGFKRNKSSRKNAAWALERSMKRKWRELP